MENDSPLLDPDLVPCRFGLAEDVPALLSDWHAHARPQLLYASEGAMRLWAADRLVVLPPERAAWIGAGVAHRVEARRPVRLRTVYFDVSDDGEPGAVTVFSAPPLLREMAIQAAAWGPSPPDRPEVAPFFAAFAAFAAAWRAAPLAADLPAARSPEIAAALVFLLDRLDRPVGVHDAARVAGMGVRTLERRCRAELGCSLQGWLVRARILAALELLADPGRSVGEVAEQVGYASIAAFSRAFRAQMGSPPSAWRGAAAHAGPSVLDSPPREGEPHGHEQEGHPRADR